MPRAVEAKQILVLGHSVLLHSRNRKTTLFLIFLRQSFSSKLELIDAVRLAGRRASGNQGPGSAQRSTGIAGTCWR